MEWALIIRLLLVCLIGSFNWHLELFKKKEWVKWALEYVAQFAVFCLIFWVLAGLLKWIDIRIWSDFLAKITGLIIVFWGLGHWVMRVVIGKVEVLLGIATSVENKNENDYTVCIALAIIGFIIYVIYWLFYWLYWLCGHV